MSNFQNSSPELSAKISYSEWPGNRLILMTFFVIFLSSFGKCQENISIRPWLLPFKWLPFHYSRIIVTLTLCIFDVLTSSFVSREQKAGQNHDAKTDNKFFEYMKNFRRSGRALINQNCACRIKTKLYSGNVCYHVVQNFLYPRLLSTGFTEI